MSATQDSAPDPLANPRVFQALQDYQAEVDAGHPPEHTEFVSRYPDVAEALAGCLRGFDFLWAAAPRATHHGAPGAAAVALTTESRLGDFRILREVGRGGMGVVYEAEQVSLGRRVALKVVSAPALDDRARQRFRNEAHAAASLRHPHIVPVYAVGAEGDSLFLAMQFVEGRSLAALVRQLQHSTGPAVETPANTVGETGRPTATSPEVPAETHEPLPFPAPPAPDYYRAVARLAASSADALQHAHDFGIVHRDIKPGNLLVEPNGNLWVADFGLAHLPGSGDLTRTGEMLGTLRYMSPEQAGGSAIDHRTDVYSLGATLYELLTLRAAFPDTDAHDVLRRIATEEPPAPRAIAPAVPRDLETVVLKAMAKEPAERYAAAREFAADLKRFLEDRPVLARRPTLAHRLRKWAKRNRGLVLAAAGVFVLFLTSAVVGLAITADRIRHEHEQTEKANAELTDRNTELDLTVGALNRSTADLGKANTDLTAALRKARQAEYTYKFLAARREWLACNIARANQLLDECPEEWRRWEWGYLKNLCRPGMYVLDPGTPNDASVRRLVLQLAWHADGTHLSLVDSETVRVWDTPPEVRPGRPRFTIEMRPGEDIRLVAFSPDRTRLYTARAYPVGQSGKRLDVRDAANGTALAAADLPGHPLAFSPDGRRLVCAGSSGLNLVTLPDGEPLPGFRPVAPSTDAHVQFAPSGRWVVVSQRAGGTALLDPSTGRTDIEAPTPKYQDVSLAAVSPNDRLLAVRTEKHAVTVWDLATRRELHALRGHTGMVSHFTFAPDGRRLATAGKDRTVRVWDAFAGTELLVFRGHDAEVTRVAFAPDGLRLATADRTGRLIVWDTTTDQQARALPATTGAALLLVFTADGTRVIRPGVAGFQTSEAVSQVVDLANGSEAISRHGARGSIAVPVSGGRGEYLTPGRGARGVWTCWDAAGERATALPGLDGQACLAVTSPDGSLLAVAGWQGGSIALLDFPAGTRRFLLTGHKPANPPLGETPLPYPLNVYHGRPVAVNGLAFHPRDGQLASAGADGTVRVWDVRTGACVHTLIDHKGEVGGVTYDPDGRWLVSVGFDGTARLYDANSGEHLRTLTGGEGELLAAAAFTPDGSRLATIGKAGLLRIWDPATGEEYLSVPDFVPIRSLAFGPDGRFLVAGELNGNARVWDGAESGPDQRLARLAGRTRAWYLGRATDAEKQKDWFAATWYWEQLVTREPENADFKARLTKAKAALAASRPKP